MNVLKLAFIFCLITATNGCEVRQREKELNERNDSLNHKEQQLLLLQNQLNVEKTELAAKQHILDSLLKKHIQQDSTYTQIPFLVGKWSVKMVCTEATCAGSAVGDNKTEVWEISYKDNVVFAKAIVNNQLVRVYSGQANDKEVKLIAQQEPASMGTSIAVNLVIKNENELEGERKIIRPEECRVIYSIQMQKIITP